MQFRVLEKFYTFPSDKLTDWHQTEYPQLTQQDPLYLWSLSGLPQQVAALWPALARGKSHHRPGLEMSSPGLPSVVVVPPAGAATLIADQLITYHYNYHSGGEILIVKQGS